MKRYSDFKQWCLQTYGYEDEMYLKSYSKLYSNEQILVGLEPNVRVNYQEDSNKLISFIYEKLAFLGVPQSDIEKNYKNITYAFVNWLIGEQVIQYDEKLDDIETINRYKNISFHKGFYFYGNTGVGKTTFVDAVSLALDKFNGTTSKPIIFYSHSKKCGFCPIKIRANQITRNYSIGGYIGKMENNTLYGGIDKFFQVEALKGQRIITEIKEWESTEASTFGKKVFTYDGFIDYIKNEKKFTSITQDNNNIGCYPCLYIDDFAWSYTSGETNNFGNSINPVEEVLKNRYDENMLTFITSNVIGDNMTDATKDRLKAQFNVIVFDKNISFRI